jgi:hypothetical protein
MSLEAFASSVEWQMEAESIRVKAYQRLATRLESPSVRSLSPLFRSLSNSNFFGVQ